MSAKVGIIPARFASTRLPGKPLLPIGSKPMIQHVYERASKSRILDEVYVATDDPRIDSCVKSFGGNSIMTSPTAFSGTDRVAEAADAIPEAEIIVNIQGDEPFVDVAVIDAMLECFNDPDVHMSTPVRILDKNDDLHNPNRVKVVLDNNHNALFFSRSAIPFARDVDAGEWAAKQRYYLHLGLYAYRKAFLEKFVSWPPGSLELVEGLEQLRVLENGFKIKTVITEADSLCVDTEEDLNAARAVYQESMGE